MLALKRQQRLDLLKSGKRGVAERVHRARGTSVRRMRGHRALARRHSPPPPPLAFLCGQPPVCRTPHPVSGPSARPSSRCALSDTPPQSQPLLSVHLWARPEL